MCICLNLDIPSCLTEAVGNHKNFPNPVRHHPRHPVQEAFKFGPQELANLMTSVHKFKEKGVSGVGWTRQESKKRISMGFHCERLVEHVSFDSSSRREYTHYILERMEKGSITKLLFTLPFLARFSIATDNSFVFRDRCIMLHQLPWICWVYVEFSH